MLSDHRAVDEQPPADATWHTSDGGVRAEAAVALRTGLDVLEGLAGVREGHRDGGSLKLLVERVASDRVLVRLLEQGWHVHAVNADGTAVAIEARREPAS